MGLRDDGPQIPALTTMLTRARSPSLLLFNQSKQRYMPAPTRIEAYNDRKFQNVSFFTDDERRVGLFVNEKVYTGRWLGFFVGRLSSMGRGDDDSTATLINQLQMNEAVCGAQDTNGIDALTCNCW